MFFSTSTQRNIRSREIFFWWKKAKERNEKKVKNSDAFKIEKIGEKEIKYLSFDETEDN